MTFDKSCYQSADSYHSWKTQLPEHTRVNFYSLSDFNDYYSELESRTNQIEYLNSQNRE